MPCGADELHINACTFIIIHLSGLCYFSAEGARWQKYLKTFANWWERNIQRWIGEKKVPTLVVQYERLHTDLYTELKRMVDFLGVPYTENDLQCAVNSNSEIFHRKHHETIDPYTKKQRELFLQKIQSVNKILQPYNISYNISH